MPPRSHTSMSHKIFMLSLLLMVGITLVFSISSKKDFNISKIEIQIEKIKGQMLVSKKEVLSILKKTHGYEVLNTEIKNLDLYAFESRLESDSRIRNAELYIDKGITLHIYIEQSLPIVRIKTEDYSYYLDQDGKKIKWSDSGTIRVPVATGNIERYHEDYLKKKENSKLFQVYDLALRLFNNPQFLSPLVEQIHVEKDDDIVLIPKLGREKIHFGKFENVENKFYRLSEFYRDGLPKEGWGKYEVLRLDINDRVTAQRYNQ